MFKEFVSLAIIGSFILNIIFVDHPNTTSYTLYFSLSLFALSPFALLWRWYWSRNSDIGSGRDVSGAIAMAATGDLEAGLGGAREAGSTDAGKELLEYGEVRG